MASEKLPSLWDVKDEITNAIDAYEWKHSWHLPRDSFGYIDWLNPQTAVKCRDVLEGYASQAIAFAAKCDRLRRVLDNTIRRREPPTE